MPSLTAWNPTLTTTAPSATTVTVTRTQILPVLATTTTTTTLPANGGSVTIDAALGTGTVIGDFQNGDTFYVTDGTITAIFQVTNATGTVITADYTEYPTYYGVQGNVIAQGASIVGQRRLPAAVANWTRSELTVNVANGDAQAAFTGNSPDQFSAALYDILRISFDNTDINPALGVGESLGAKESWTIDAPGDQSATTRIMPVQVGVNFYISLTQYSEA